MDQKEKILRETLAMVAEDEGIKDPDIKIKPISTGGANYSSVLYLITIKNPGKNDLELFAKVACVGENIRKEMPLGDAYALEPFVYRELYNTYKELQEQYEIADKEKFTFSKFYASNNEYLYETLILENLVASGYTLYDRFESVTWEYASAAIGELAKFHALSYAFSEYYPEKFAKIIKEIPNLFVNDHSGSLFQMWKNSEVHAIEAVPEALKAKLKDFFPKEATLEKYNKYYSSPRRPVLVHGDYRASNLMHKMSNGKLEKLIPVDYQTVHSGAQTTDLLYFIFLGTDGEFRRRHYKQLIEHYYTTFANFLLKLNLNAEKLYSKEDFDEDLKKSLPFGLITAAFGLPILMVESENAPTMEGDATFANFNVKPNDMFKKRFREVVDDFVEWGVI